MNTLIGACGLDCSQCEAYVLTQTNDLQGMEQLLVKWRVEFNAPDMTITDVTCDGCMAGGRMVGYCSMCEIRKCSIERELENCAHCPDYGCEKLSGFFTQAPAAKENLEKFRAAI